MVGELVNCSAHASPIPVEICSRQLTKTICDLRVFSPLYRFSFRSCGAVQDEGLVCGCGTNSNAGLSGHGTRNTSINL